MMPLRAFALSTLLGMTPGTILLNHYGKSLFFGSDLPLQIAWAGSRSHAVHHSGLDQAEEPLKAVRQDDVG